MNRVQLLDVFGLKINEPELVLVQEKYDNLVVEWFSNQISTDDYLNKSEALGLNVDCIVEGIDLNLQEFGYLFVPPYSL